jgi:hypothetical protein
VGFIVFLFLGQMVAVFKDQLPEEVAQDESPPDTRGNQLMVFLKWKDAGHNHLTARNVLKKVIVLFEHNRSVYQPTLKNDSVAKIPNRTGSFQQIVKLFGIVLFRFLQLNRFSPFWAGECKQNDSQTEWSNVLWN